MIFFVQNNKNWNFDSGRYCNLLQRFLGELKYLLWHAWVHVSKDRIGKDKQYFHEGLTFSSFPPPHPFKICFLCQTALQSATCTFSMFCTLIPFLSIQNKITKLGCDDLDYKTLSPASLYLSSFFTLSRPCERLWFRMRVVISPGEILGWGKGRAKRRRQAIVSPYAWDWICVPGLFCFVGKRKGGLVAAKNGKGRKKW